jgi:hypothetical protein
MREQLARLSPVAVNPGEVRGIGSYDDLYLL